MATARFATRAYKSGAGFSEDGRPEAGMSADAADMMNNGLMYLYVSHLDFELNRMYRNNGDGTFRTSRSLQESGRPIF